jgi:hypothetical protein
MTFFTILIIRETVQLQISLLIITQNLNKNQAIDYLLINMHNK